MTRRAMTSRGISPRGITHRVVWTLFALLIALAVPWIGSKYYTFVATQISILSLFAISYNLLLGTSGLTSFGHAAYFGLGSYGCGLLMKELGLPLIVALPAGGLIAAGFAVVFGFFCVRLTKIYFSMLTLAFAQIIWAICFQWNEVTGGDQGISGIPYPELGWMATIPGLSNFRIGDYFYMVTLVLVALCIAVLHRITVSPFGRMLTTIRENPERASFIGVNVRAYELAAFVISGGFSGIAGGLFGIFNRGVFADFLFWPKSAEVLIMTILGGMNHFWGPAVGTAMLVILNQQITSYTEYWPLVLGTILMVLLFVFPGGLVGALDAGLTRLRARSRGRGSA
jgi:branched-chain amino acid transport system permease protein